MSETLNYSERVTALRAEIINEATAAVAATFDGDAAGIQSGVRFLKALDELCALSAPLGTPSAPPPVSEQTGPTDTPRRSRKMSREAFEQIIAEDIARLESVMAPCLERAHIADVLRASVALCYPAASFGTPDETLQEGR